MSARLRIKVIPGARQEAIEFRGDVLRVKVTAAPERGRANDAVVALLADRLGVATSSVRVVAGHTNAVKTVEFGTLDADALARGLDALHH